MKAPTDNKIHDACSENDKEDGGAMFVEWWNISLRGMLYDSVAVFHYADCVRLC